MLRSVDGSSDSVVCCLHSWPVGWLVPAFALFGTLYWLNTLNFGILRQVKRCIPSMCPYIRNILDSVRGLYDVSVPLELSSYLIGCQILIDTQIKQSSVCYNFFHFLLQIIAFVYRSFACCEARRPCYHCFVVFGAGGIFLLFLDSWCEYVVAETINPVFVGCTCTSWLSAYGLPTSESATGEVM